MEFIGIEWRMTCLGCQVIGVELVLSHTHGTGAQHESIHVARSGFFDQPT